MSGGSSPLGAGGHALSNGNCTIHAESAIGSTDPGLISKIQLTIDFPQSQISAMDKHIYVSVHNFDGLDSLETFLDSTGQVQSTIWARVGWWATQ